jgi:hypothetical protein
MAVVPGHSRARKVLSALILCVSALAAFWIGEGGTLFFEPLPYAPVLAGAVLAAAVFPGTWVRRAMAGSACLVVIAAVYVGGLHSYNCAFRECLRRCETVRARISEYRAENGSYPDSLASLQGPLPGRRILRPSILAYSRTQEGYELEFHDWLVEMKATESEPFAVIK